MNSLAGTPFKSASNCDPKVLRNAFGNFATGVTVVLTGAEGGEYHGMTANSFISVSLDPPLLLISLANNAKLKEMLTMSRSFSVNILSSEQEAISNHFAGRHSPDTEYAVRWSHLGVPCLSDALSCFDCELEQTVPAGDHTIAIGRIRQFTHQNDEPLLFFNGAYNRLEPKMSAVNASTRS